MYYAKYTKYKLFLTLSGKTVVDLRAVFSCKKPIITNKSATMPNKYSCHFLGYPVKYTTSLSACPA